VTDVIPLKAIKIQTICILNDYNDYRVQVKSLKTPFTKALQNEFQKKSEQIRKKWQVHSEVATTGLAGPCNWGEQEDTVIFSLKFEYRPGHPGTIRTPIQRFTNSLLPHRNGLQLSAVGVYKIQTCYKNSLQQPTGYGTKTTEKQNKKRNGRATHRDVYLQTDE
jgi:hypothetical protein